MIVFDINVKFVLMFFFFISVYVLATVLTITRPAESSSATIRRSYWAVAATSTGRGSM